MDVQPHLGVRAVTWTDIQATRYTRSGYEDGRGLSTDHDAFHMNTLRGLIMVQAAETEAVLGQILLNLDPEAKPETKMAKELLKAVWRKLPEPARSYWFYELHGIRLAQKKRNRAVHDRATIGSSWVDYATEDGGEWVPVISFLGNKEYSSGDLLSDLALQQNATVSSLDILHSLECVDCKAGTGCPDRV
jgi:hypothetical protein